MAIGSPFFNPVFQFVDPNGVPYAGGSLAFYATGTNTPLATYADIGLTIPNPNPIVLNSSGFPAVSIFLQALEYRAVLSDVNGIQIWTADPIFSGGNFTSTVVTEGTGSIGFQAINTSANGQTWGWYSNADGSFSAVDNSNNATIVSISDVGVVTVNGDANINNSGSALISVTSTSSAGNQWAFRSNVDGSADIACYGTTLTPLTLEGNGSGFAFYGWTFESTISVAGLGTFLNGVYVSSGQLTVNGASDFIGGVTVGTGALTVNASALFEGQVTYTGGTTPTVSGIGNPGIAMVNTAVNGHAWSVVSTATGTLAFNDNTAAVIRGYFDTHGVLYLNGGPTTATDSGTFGILTTAGASTTTGNYNFGLSVAQGVTALAYSATSDSRLKWDIEEISAEDAWAYVMAGRPVRYSMSHAKRLAGFIAQDDIKAGHGRGDAILAHNSPDLEEATDPDGFVSPGGVQFTRNYDHDIAFLTRALQDLQRIVTEQSAQILSLTQGPKHASP